MLQKACVAVIVVRLVLAPWAVAQEPGPSPGPIVAAAAREAARAAPTTAARSDPMPKGLTWTGIGLAIAGGVTMLSTALGNCERNCDRAVGYVVGGAELLVGSFLLDQADRRRAPAPPDEPEPAEPSIRASAEREAARMAPTGKRGPMSNALKWTGIGLLAGAPLPTAIAHFGDCLPDGPRCDHQRRQAYVATGLLAGTGALLLVIGEAKRPPALPSLTFGDGRAAIIQRVTF